MAPTDMSKALHRRSNSTTRRSLSIRQKSVAPGIDLRVLPLGDSITFGFQSTDGNGYREALHNDLTASGEYMLGKKLQTAFRWLGSS